MKKLLTILAIFCAIELTIEPAQAYLDPGTGSMIIQILAATAATVLIFFKSIISSVKNIFIKNPKNDTNEDDE